MTLKDGVTMYQKPSNSNEDRTSEIRRTENQDRSFFNSDGYELPGQHKKKTEPQSERIPGANGEGGNGLGLRRRGFDRQTVLDFLKKLARRLELLEEEYINYVSSHRSRLIARLNENEEFARKVQPEVASLKEDIAELTRVLGASELESTE